MTVKRTTPLRAIRHIICSLLLLMPLAVSAQNMTVESFRQLENDLAAITNGTMEFDQNGEVAALIKIVVQGSGFTFDVGSMGVVKTRQMGGEWWVYVPRGVQRITINHPKYGVMRNYYFDIPIEGACTYEMVLNPGVGKYMNIVSSQSGALVIMDGDTVGTTPVTQYYVVYGDHHITAQKGRMFGELQTTVSEKSESAINIEMEDQSYLYARVRMNVPGNAEIWYNGERQTVGTWNTELKVGTYVIETRKINCSNAFTTVEVTQGGTNTFNLNAPEPYHGYLMLHVPQQNVIVIDRTSDLVLRPETQERLLVGTHLVTFNRKGYIEVEKEYTMERDQVVMDTIRLERFPFIRKNQFYLGGGGTISQMPGATVILGGTIYNVDLELSYTLGLTWSKSVSWYKDNTFYSIMRYKENSLGARLGYQVKISSRMSITPQVGISMATLSGACIQGAGMLGNGATGMYLTVGGKLFIFPTKHLALFVRPEYAAQVGSKTTYHTVIDKCGLAAGGFAATAGLTVNF
jgi:hypothetical protein